MGANGDEKCRKEERGEGRKSGKSGMGTICSSWNASYKD